MKPYELRTKSKTELTEMLRSTQKEQFKLKMLKNTGQLEKLDQIKKLRKDIARINTILAEMVD
jgi:large subunit ribosomal protein L29